MTRLRRIHFALLTTVGLALPAAADDVHLTDGRVFEDVVARTEGPDVVVQFAGGTLRLPASRVARIERRAGALDEYLTRRRELAAGEGSAARDWLDLAHWARDRGLDSGVREAARKAASLDPDLGGLAPLMRALGYVRDESGGPWLLPDELMARRGYVRHGGSWITAGERAELLRAEADGARKAREARSEASRDRALELLAAAAHAQAETTRAREEREDRRAFAPSWIVGAPGWFVPVPIVVPVPVPPPIAVPVPPPARPDSNRGSFAQRVPGRLDSTFVPGRLNPRAAPPPGRLDSR